MGLTVLVLERASPSLRGELTRWLIEPRAGVFVGDLSAEVRDRLWAKCLKRCPGGAVLQLWSTNNEQGFSARAAGDPRRELVDHDGLLLVRIPTQQPDLAKEDSAST